MAASSRAAAAAPTTVVDIHTHMYPPQYIKMLEARDTIPLVRHFPQSPSAPRLVLLESEIPALQKALHHDDDDAAAAKPPGRPLTSHFVSLDQKMHFMDTHRIDISVISLANPWLDFVDAAQSGDVARSVNAEFDDMCRRHHGRLFFFGTLPLTAPLDTIRGATTVAVARMYLAGVFDRVPRLRMLLAHSGGTLPFLAGRIESCLVHDAQLVRDGKVSPRRRTVWDVLREHVYLDAVIYSDVGLKAAIHASGGADRLMFGTDHPFFPPVTADEQGAWESVTLNADAVARAVGEGSDDAAAIMGLNAVRVLNLKV
ncbi:amidohydrolase [Moelleriella libera RCEF 2490]|uniref:Amidohydrolase n=1 Tax=Moelleriella libera RCEF 2490 TaxID=1081109 RepID=A0A168DDH3_9HYPO|nr:amidohydrolase [Moelleriella libera RCEF 2490]